jgi:hypothetical protein
MTPAATLTRPEAAAAAEQARDERDRIQANLLELDQSLGQRILDGAAGLTGRTAAQWETARAQQTRLWQTFLAYAAVVDRATGLAARHHRPAGPDLAELSTLLTGPAVRLPHPPAPLAQRDLTDPGSVDLTLAAAVAEMRAAYTDVAAILAAAESVWTTLAGPLDEAAQTLATARSQLEGLTGDRLTSQLAAAEAERTELHELLNTDPLSLWHPARPGNPRPTGSQPDAPRPDAGPPDVRPLAGGAPGAVDTARLDRLQAQVADVAARAAEVAALRADADTRLAAAAAAVTAAVTAGQDAEQARAQAATKIAVTALPPGPEPTAQLTARLAALHELQAAGRWGQLSDGLAAVARQAADLQQIFSENVNSARGLLGRRDELRGLLGAYQAKAAALGSAEDVALSAAYRRAQGLLWTAPCDLAAADQAVRAYQDAVLARSRREARS